MANFAYGIATFTGVSDSANFTWSPLPGSGALVSNPPKVLAMSMTTTDGSMETASLSGSPTNIGGTVQATAAFTGSVVLLASD